MRELVAEDYVYSIKRSLDPNLRNGGDATLTDLLEGARPVVDAARKAGGKFDYDARIPGLVATDRHTLTIRLTRPDFTVLERLAVLPSFAVAREVVEAAGKDVVSKPVGTGPFVLKQWTRASRVVLEANPGYRFCTANCPSNQPLTLCAERRWHQLPFTHRTSVSASAEPSST